ncbi:MAG: hypothetical protein EXS09_18055 [Gemmataceae bacterium]|nr:hypothetical protein [Gemmataceae bacterium]
MILSPRSIALGLIFVVSACTQAAEIPKPPEWNRVKNDVVKMRNGSIRVRNPDSPAETKKNQDAIKIVAQYLAFTIATPPYDGEPIPREDKTPAFPERSIPVLLTEADYYCTIPITTANMGKLTVEQYEYGAEMGTAMAEAVKVVLENSPRPIVRINAIRLMVLTAKMPAPALAPVFLQIIVNPKVSDAEKLYAFQGLRNLMEQADLIDASRHVIRDVNVLGQISEALAAYIVQDRGRPDDREKAVIEFVRRHAITALAQFKDAAIRKPNKDLISRPSWTLMRVIASDPTVSPPFTIQEKVEAAIGFCQQKVDPEMNLDVAAYNLAGVNIPGVIVEFSRTANLDAVRATKTKERDGSLPAAHWKALSARLSYALAVWRENCKSLPATRSPQNVVTFATGSIAVLTPIEREGGAAATGAEVGALTTWSSNYKPKAWLEDPPKPAQLYKDDPTSLLPFYVAAPKAADPKLTTPAVKPPDPTPVAPKKGPTPPPK